MTRAGRPVILAACDDPGDMRRIECELRSRYEADYCVVFEGSAGAGLKTLQNLEGAGDEVALVLADQQMRGMSGVEFLTRVGEVYPTAKRLLLTTRTERSGGAGRLEHLVLEDGSGSTETVSAAALFVLIGAEPRTGWLPAEIERGERGFIATGADLTRKRGSPGGWPLERRPLPLETSMPGVFAAGDARYHSVKRVASAVGEGSISIQQVHKYLSQIRPRLLR